MIFADFLLSAYSYCSGFSQLSLERTSLSIEISLVPNLTWRRSYLTWRTWFLGPTQSLRIFPANVASSIGALEHKRNRNSKSQITVMKVSGFSVQVSVFLFFFPDT
jgi:hypothetical protein